MITASIHETSLILAIGAIIAIVAFFIWRWNARRIQEEVRYQFNRAQALNGLNFHSIPQLMGAVAFTMQDPKVFCDQILYDIERFGFTTEELNGVNEEILLTRCAELLQRKVPVPLDDLRAVLAELCELGRYRVE